MSWKMVETAGYFLAAVWAGVYDGFVESNFEKCGRLKMEKQNPRAYHLANLFFVLTVYTLPLDG